MPPTTLSTPQLVVNGLITDQPGPYTMKVANVSLTSINFNSYPTYGTHVFIHDSVGNLEELKEVSAGTFETSPNGIQGIVGRSYSVVVVLKDNSRYESTPELLKAVAPISNIVTTYHDLPRGGPSYKVNLQHTLKHRIQRHWVTITNGRGNTTV